MSSKKYVLAFFQCLFVFGYVMASSPDDPKPNAQTASAVLVQPEPTKDPQRFPQGFYSGDPLPPHTIYLTFDDGPCDFTTSILDVLKEENVHATFFLNSYDKDNPFHQDTGKNLLFKFSDQLNRMVTEGHAIGNHTYSHREFSSLTPAQLDFQLSTLYRQVSEVLGKNTPPIHLIRPPFGNPWYGNFNTADQQRHAATFVQNRGLIMMWSRTWDSSDSVDWARGEWYKIDSVRYHPDNDDYKKKMDRELSRLLAKADGGESGVILMHDTHPTTRDVLKKLIVELKRRGYVFDNLENYCRWRWGPNVFDRFQESK